MPVLNAEEFLPSTLTSIKAQTYSNWELIIINDGSEDNSLTTAEKFSIDNPGKCKIIDSLKKQSGAAACRNKGLHFATGQYIIFLDSDDLLEEFCLQQRITVMQNEPLLDWAVFMQYQRTPEEGSPNKLFNKSVFSREEAIKYFLQMDPPWQTMAPIWKKQTLIICGGFDESLICMEDPDLHLRALLNDDLKVSIEFNLPADCFYRLSAMDEEKSKNFLSLKY